MFGRRKTPTNLDNVERGRVFSPGAIGYTSFPWDTHPNDRYTRVVPTGPFTQAWEGVQKLNLISTVGTRRQPIRNPLQEIAARRSTVNMNVEGSAGAGSGPALIAYYETTDGNYSDYLEGFYG